MSTSKHASVRLDDAARAGWLYYVAGRTQDEIARSMGVSRQTAQRLVSLAVTARLIRVSVEHPIARCLDLAEQLTLRFGLRLAEVVPSDPGADGGTVGLGEAGAAEIARWLRRASPVVMAIGTGRTLKAAVDLLPPLTCPQHRVVSLIGSIAPDGSAAHSNVIFSMSETVSARHYPMPLPVFVSTAEERRLIHAQPLTASILALADAADVAFVGIGEMDETAPLFVDGFIQHGELKELRAAGAVGEICGWIFDAGGQLLAGDRSLRTASATIPARDRTTVVALAKGAKKLTAIRAAVGGGLVNALITDETTAERLLETS